MRESKLKPCPFCGGEAEITQIGDNRKSTLYACLACGASLETGETFNHGSVWNERTTGKWTAKPPTEQGLYWHWNGNYENAPTGFSIIKSVTNGKCFISVGQYGITKPIYCEDYEGYWMLCVEPELQKGDV